MEPLPIIGINEANLGGLGEEEARLRPHSLHEPLPSTATGFRAPTGAGRLQEAHLWHAVAGDVKKAHVTAGFVEGFGHFQLGSAGVKLVSNARGMSSFALEIGA